MSINKKTLHIVNSPLYTINGNGCITNTHRLTIRLALAIVFNRFDTDNAPLTKINMTSHNKPRAFLTNKWTMLYINGASCTNSCAMYIVKKVLFCTIRVLHAIDQALTTAKASLMIMKSGTLSASVA